MIYKNNDYEFNVEFVRINEEKFNVDENFTIIGGGENREPDLGGCYLLSQRKKGSDEWREYGKYETQGELEYELYNNHLVSRGQYCIAVCFITHTKYKVIPREDGEYETGTLVDEYTNDDPYYEVLDGWDGECLEQFGSFEEAQEFIKDMEEKYGK